MDIPRYETHSRRTYVIYKMSAKAPYRGVTMDKEEKERKAANTFRLGLLVGVIGLALCPVGIGIPITILGSIISCSAFFMVL